MISLQTNIGAVTIILWCLYVALLTFADGRFVGAILDRNGLRPSRFYVSKDNVMYMASEVGTANVEPQDVIQKGRLKPGRLLLVDTKSGQFIKDELIKEQIAGLRPVANWIQKEVVFFKHFMSYSSMFLVSL